MGRSCWREAYLHPLTVLVIMQETACFANDNGELSALAIPSAVALVLQTEQCQWSVHSRLVHVLEVRQSWAWAA
jgi:hypothetical protein